MGTGKSTTGGQHVFSLIPSAAIQRSRFDRSCGLKTSFNAGLLIPIFADEGLPGDTFSMKMSCFGRLATLINPVMENMWLDFFFFAVPNRLVWDNWQKFCGEQRNPGDSVDFTVPVVTVPDSTGFQEGSIFDYMGVPTKRGGRSCDVNALHFRAYNLIYNEWFRDENLQNSLTVNTGDGPDVDTVYSLMRRGKRHDYFTSCLPWPQKGTAVTLPLGTYAPVVSDLGIDGGVGQPVWRSTGNATPTHYMQTGGSGSIPQVMLTNNPTTANSKLTWDTGVGKTGLVADLNEATAATINQLREAFQIQRMFERDARGGTRYTELLRSHFGVVSPDARLQRPEYLGGGSVRISVNTVAATNQSTAADQEVALGELGAFATAAGHGIGFNHSFTEHCVVLGLVCLRADLNYQNGMERMWFRRTRFDYYWPSLAHLGEQAVLKKELNAVGSASDDTVFGYQERYAEYRYKPSRVTGMMRSNHSQPLDSWHLAQDFGANSPTLDGAFIEENAPFDRIIAFNPVSGAPHAILDCFFQYRCVRPMPVYGVPGLIDHF